MWPFKRKKYNPGKQGPNNRCPHCGSTQVVLKDIGGDQPAYVKTWRGQRYLTCHCNDCRQDFYIDASSEEVSKISLSEESMIQDEEALEEAEAELKKQADDDNDHMFR